MQDLAEWLGYAASYPVVAPLIPFSINGLLTENPPPHSGFAFTNLMHPPFGGGGMPAQVFGTECCLSTICKQQKQPSVAELPGSVIVESVSRACIPSAIKGNLYHYLTMQCKSQLLLEP